MKQMKQILLLMSVCVITFACTKDKVPPSIQKSFYQSNGNFLVLKVGTVLEGAYEYQLNTTVLSNDSLPLIWDHSVGSVDGMSGQSILRFFPNQDTIIDYFYQQQFDYHTQLVDTSLLQKLSVSIPYNHADFQILFPSNTVVSDAMIWSKMANLDIVKTYRTSNPTAKIGIQRIIDYEYNPQVGCSLPIEKYLVFFVK